MHSFKFLPLLLLSLIFSLNACKKDLAPLKKSALSIVDSKLEKLGEYQGNLNGLLKKSKTLPKDLKGVEGLSTNLEKYKKSLEDVTKKYTNAKAKIESSVSAGNQSEFSSIVKEIKNYSPAVASLGVDIAGAEASYEKFHKAAIAAAKAKAKAKAAIWSAKLPSGFELKGSHQGIEKNLLAFIRNPETKIDKTTWFDFDRLTFKTGSAELDLEKSKEQLTNVFEILKAFPKLNLKIGGYTDNVGKAKKNLALSKKRATSVMTQLVKMEINKKRLKAEGYGDKHPICPANDTPECKNKNRRISVRVTAK